MLFLNTLHIFNRNHLMSLANYRQIKLRSVSGKFIIVSHGDYRCSKALSVFYNVFC